MKPATPVFRPAFRPPAPNAADARYLRYCLFCKNVAKIKPLEFEAWLRESAKIPEYAAS